MVELPKTEQELNDLINASVQAKVDEMTAKHNSEMAAQRKKYDDDIRKANMTAEQLAQEKVKEQQEAQDKELSELRAFKKSTILGEKLSKEGLPSYFKNDNRLLTAEEGDLDKVIKDIKKEYEADRPKGATYSTVVQTGGQKATGDAKQQAFEEMGKALGELVGK